jgi:hypothetical protein
MIFRKMTKNHQAPPIQQPLHISLIRRIGRFFSALMRSILSPGKKHFSTSAPLGTGYWVDGETDAVKGRLIHNSDSLKIELNAVQAAPPEGWVLVIKLIGALKSRDSSNQ